MGNLFGGKKPHRSSKQPAITDQDRAILVKRNSDSFVYSFVNFFVQQLKQQRDRLNQNRRRIESQLERERDVAKQLLKNGQKE